jgi:hypothetical protein
LSFLRDHAKGVADNIVAAILLTGGSAVLGYLAKYLTMKLGVPSTWSLVVGWAAFLFIAVALSLLLKPKQHGGTEHSNDAPTQKLTQNGIVNAPHLDSNLT